MAAPSLEDRVAALETELEQLKQQHVAHPIETDPWWKKIVGIYKDDPAYEEAMRLGREWRESSRPEDYEHTS